MGKLVGKLVLTLTTLFALATLVNNIPSSYRSHTAKEINEAWEAYQNLPHPTVAAPSGEPDICNAFHKYEKLRRIDWRRSEAAKNGVVFSKQDLPWWDKTSFDKEYKQVGAAFGKNLVNALEKPPKLFFCVGKYETVNFRVSWKVRERIVEVVQQTHNSFSELDMSVALANTF